MLWLFDSLFKHDVFIFSLFGFKTHVFAHFLLFYFFGSLFWCVNQGWTKYGIDSLGGFQPNKSHRGAGQSQDDSGCPWWQPRRQRCEPLSHPGVPENWGCLLLPQPALPRRPLRLVGPRVKEPLTNPWTGRSKGGAQHQGQPPIPPSTPLAPPPL